MDSNIRKLVHAASQDNDLSALTEAYEKLRKERQSSVDNKIDGVSADLFVLCAEAALKHGQFDIMEDSIKMFFLKTPPSNQFLCRAYLCQAQLNAPASSKNPEQLDRAVEYLLKAINFAKKNLRYYFLVYNASVLYWQFCRPFLKPNYRQYLAKSLHQVVKALDDIDDKDYGWRAQLMIALIECHVDAGRKEDATQISIATLAFTKSNVPSLYTTVLGLQVRHRLIDLSKASKEARASNELYIFYKIQRLRTLVEAEEKLDLDLELNKIYKSIVKGVDTTDRAGTATSAGTSTSKTSSPRLVSSNDRIPLLIELGRLCLENNKHELATSCLENLRGGVKSSDILLEIEFMRCELMVQSLGEKKENYSKAVVEKRIKAIRKLEQCLMTAVRMGNPNVIQTGCVTMWNLSLPLLQANLRHHVRKSLTLAAQALEDIDSLLVLLRCQMHTELAKCEEAEDQLEYAVTHLRKALELDDSGMYYDRLQTALTRLQLRATLYKTPERAEDLAAMIIEQARASDDASTVRMKRALLVKAGEALSPDAFMLVLDGESSTKDPSATKGPPTVLGGLAGRAKQFEKGVSKAAGHLKRLGDENDQERVRIWADLAKTARKQQVWDAARVAARFCLLYDDNRWSRKNAGNTSEKHGDGGADREDGVDSRTPVHLGESGSKLDVTGMKLLYPRGMTAFSVENDLLRTLAEVRFIFAEALLHLLRTEGVQLGDKRSPPEDTIKVRPKRYGDQMVNFDEIPEWVTYCDWIASLSNEVIHSFHRAAEIGVELKEPWLVYNAAVYLWNYTTHLLSQGRYKEVIPIYSPVLDAVKVTGHAGETVLLCQMCNAIAQGFMQSWIPALTPPTAPATPTKEKSEMLEKTKGRQSGKGAKGMGAPSKGSLHTAAVDPEATPDLKQALEVLEYALNTTNGEDPKTLVPISARHPLIRSWVFCKQLLNQPMPKNLGHDNEDLRSQGPMCRALCAVEMLSLQNNGLPEFTGTCPSLSETVKMVDGCQWTDDLVELQMWSTLSVLAFNAENHSLVLRCGHRAVAFAESDKCLAKRNSKKPDSLFQHMLVVEQEMLYYASAVMGQSLMKNMQGKNEIRREALVCFVNACRFGQKAENYDLVIAAARHYWNAIKPFIVEPIERELLREPMEAVLESIAAVADNEGSKGDEDDDEDTESSTEKKSPSKPSGSKEKGKKGKEKEGEKKKGKEKDTRKAALSKESKTEKGDLKKSKQTDEEGKTGKPATEQEEKPATIPSAYDEDLMLRAAMYGVLFQAYADKGEWEQGLRAMDQAVKDMPRTHHRLLIFKHRVLTKAKLGRNVIFDMGKFKNEKEDVIAAMWRHVALNSKAPEDQLTAYQNAVEVLESPDSDWQKVDYLMEFGEWLFVNEYPVEDAVDQFLWASDILLNKKPNEDGREDDHHIDGRSELESESVDTAKLVPGQHHSLFGVQPSGQALKVEDITDIRQLENLIRVHVMLAHVAGHCSPHSVDYVLMAYAFLYRILQVSISSAERIQKEGGKPGERAPSKKGKEKGKESFIKVEKSTGKTVFPTTMEGWATFELSEKLQEYFRCDITGTMINKATFQKPMLTLHYTQTLLRDLRDMGYHQLGLPVLAMQQIVADLICADAQLKKLVHLRAMELCQELNILSGVSHHEKSAGYLLLTEQEQAKSREEIEMWKEKQRQVKTEEQKSKTSKSVVFDTRTSNLVLRPHAPGGEDSNEGESWNKHKWVISDVCYREMWTEQAEILIRQGQFLPARQLLTEANLSARAFDDKRCLSNILLQFAVMALAESNWGQATSLLLEAQKLHGDQRFWLTTTLLLCEASILKIDKSSTTLTTPDLAAKEKACYIIFNAKRVFKDLAEENPNKANMAEYIEAVLEAKLGSLLSDHLVNDRHLRKRNREHKELLIACKHLSQAATDLNTLGHRREAIKTMLKHAAIKRTFAEDCDSPEERQGYFLEAFDTLKEAARLSDAVLHDVQSANTLSELRNLSLPVQRETVNTKLVISSLMIDMLKQFSEESREKRERETQKGSIQKMIDDFVSVEPTPTEGEQKWIDVTRTLAEDIMMQLSMAHAMTGNVAYLKAKTLYALGRCLAVLAAHTSPDSESQWKEVTVDSQEEEVEKSAPHMNPAPVEPENEYLDTEVPEIESTQKPSRELLQYANRALELNTEYSTSKRYLSQAVECLTQCVQIGLRHGYRDIICAAARDVVDCIGAHDPLTSSQYLALHQSCHQSRVLEGVLSRVQLDPSVSRQAAMLRQRTIITEPDFLNDASSRLLASNSNHLSECEAWRRLTIARNHLELTREFSVTNIQFVVLQHSPDRRYLYGAVLDKGRSPVASGKTNKQSSTLPVPTKPMITRAAVNSSELEQLIEEFSLFKSNTASELMRRNYVKRQQEQKRKMLAKLEDTSLHTENQQPSNVDSSFAEKEAQLESHFKDVVAAIEAYLDPVLTKLHAALNPEAVSEAVVLLADEWLLQLPLEALNIFAVPQITSLSRDFSLQFHYHRVHPAERSDSSSKTAAKGAKKPEKAKSDKPSTAKSGQKSEKKGKETGSGVAKEGPVVDFNGVRYIVDPHNECSDEDEDNPSKVMSDIIVKFKSFSTKWNGIMGSDHLPSVGELQRVISESSSFIFYGTERFLGSLPPSMLAPMNITDCHFVVLLDLVQTGKSFLRQGKEDATKAVGELWLERPLETAMLLSLVGVAGVVSNQWHCQLADNKHKLHACLSDVLESSKTVGQAVRRLVHFPRPSETEPETEVVSDRGSKIGSHPIVEETGDENTAPREGGNGGGDEAAAKPLFSRHWFNTILYGTPTLLLNPQRGT
ncbi:cilia- and flagella-associated protein 46-like [Acropora palmata]|uniref:cilia- and flagella-associated protein 46-like n=1 Tax=Acropora palmata TaxID=6131 RepID=UPI003DA06D73